VSDVWIKLARGASMALPGVEADLDAFAIELKRRADESGGPEAINAADLLLAFAALRKDPVATKELDRRMVRAVRVSIGRFAGLQPDEIEQQVRQRVLVGDGASGPRLTRYTGRGAIVAWLKAVATSLAIDESRRLKPERHADEDELVATASSEAGPETTLLNAQQKHHFNAAFREALTNLSPQERTVMRMRFVDNLAVEDIGKAFAVHRTTAMRWLEKAQEEVMTTTRKVLGKRLGMRSREVDSLMRVLKPSINDRISRLLSPVKTPAIRR
jgi:RNA polymerase sigma-70 factor, ECF subfamily